MPDKRFRDIPGSQFFGHMTRLRQAACGTEQYRIEQKTSGSLVLELTRPEEYEQGREYFKYLTRLYAYGIPMSRPLDFGTCLNGQKVYLLRRYVEGSRADQTLGHLTALRQYELGCSAGRILAKIHSLPIRESFDWSDCYRQETEYQLAQYHSCGVALDGEDAFLQRIRRGQESLSHRPVTSLHGEYTLQNLLVTPHQTLAVQNFRNRLGDPYSEFVTMPQTSRVSPPFCAGQLHGYFSGACVAEDFFELTAYYLAVSCLSAFSSCVHRGGYGLDAIKEQAALLLRSYDGFESGIPDWYRSFRQ